MGKELIGSLELNRIYQMDCIEGMRLIPDKSVDMILCDLPYGTTACKWDTVIPFDKMWEQYERIIKNDGAIVLTASQPFSSALVASKIKLFKHEWIWQKEQGVGFQVAKYRPMQEHEHVLVFAKGKTSYKPIMEKLEKPQSQKRKSNNGASLSSPLKYSDERISVYKERYPTSIKKFNRDKGLHPTQKPVSLFEYLIKTYTNEGETILDNCMGSGTTAVAALRTNRKFIGFELESEYVRIANQRIENVTDEIAEMKLTESEAE
jgi:site-specific DNA-methyltransferase (adenine-specific)